MVKLRRMEMFKPIILGISAFIVVFLEFFLPGGIMAALGCVLAMGSVVFAMAIDLKIGIYFLCVEAVVMGVVIHFALRSVKKSRISLNDDQSGYTSCDLDISLIGKEARVSKDLKPAGFIEIDGVEFQALSKGGYLKKDQIVRIIDGEGARFIVR